MTPNVSEDLIRRAASALAHSGVETEDVAEALVQSGVAEHEAFLATRAALVLVQARAGMVEDDGSGEGDYEPNAPIDRLRYVVKTYAHMPVVAWETIRVALNTLGIERMDMDSALFDGTGAGTWRAARSAWEFPSPDARGTALTMQRISDLFEIVEPEIPASFEYDFLFPWVAAELAPIAKRTQRAWKLEQEGKLTHPDAVHWYDEAPVFIDTADALAQRGTAIAQWALANRVDLGKVTAAEALDAAKNFKVVVRVPQGKVVFDYGDGWTVQELPPEALKAEGEVMQHCVGSYCERVRDESVRIFSLRDPQGQPHVTMERLRADEEVGGERPRFTQIYGKQNQKPNEEYAARVRAFIREKFNAEPLGMLLAGAEPKSLDLRGAHLVGAHLGSAHLEGADLKGADLRGADLEGAYLVGADLRGADLRRAYLVDADLKGANLEGAHLVGADLRGADLEGAYLVGADLRDAIR